MSRHRDRSEASALTHRLDALNKARELGEGRLSADVLAEVYQVLERASTRRSLSSEHTVVGFFGATGSGKSSLFNAVSGTSAAVVGARRPTTADPLAAVWGPAGSEELLDWLDVPRRVHPVDSAGESEPDAGLILLDLPDFDSTAAEHRRIVERMAGMVDVLVWVLDPQKYADAALHHGFLRRLAADGAVTTVVLNQIDRLSPADLEAVTASLRSVLAQDGLGDVDVLPVSARTGAGLTQLRRRIADVAQSRQAATARLTLEVGRAARSLGEAAGTSEAAGISDSGRRRLGRELAEAARVDAVAQAVAGSYRREAVKRTGWPLTRWLVRLRPDPLRRLNLGRSDVRPELNRTSLPAAGPPEHARLDSAVRTFADEAAAGASDPWRAAIRAAARRGRQDLEEELDGAVARTELHSGRLAWWWPVFGVLQWLGLLAALTGAVWLAVPAVLGYLQLPVPDVPRTQGFPVPTLLLAGGLLLGIVLALAARPFAAAGARARAAAARRRLRASVADAADAVIVRPVQAELLVLGEFTECVRRARG